MTGAVMEARRGTDVDERLIGRVNGRPGGPVLLCVAGIHGNEPAGVHAVRRVLADLGDRRDELEGSLVAFAGNIAALEAGRRFVQGQPNAGHAGAVAVRHQGDLGMGRPSQGLQQRLGPRWQVNPSNGFFPFPFECGGIGQCGTLGPVAAAGPGLLEIASGLRRSGFRSSLSTSAAGTHFVAPRVAAITRSVPAATGTAWRKLQLRPRRQRLVRK